MVNNPACQVQDLGYVISLNTTVGRVCPTQLIYFVGTVCTQLWSEMC